MPALFENEVEIPAWMGAELRPSGRLAKAAVGHKYVRRVPTGNPAHPWRYFYSIGGGARLGHPDELKSGARFQLRHGSHFEVEKDHGDAVTIHHEASGTRQRVAKAALGEMLKRQHVESVGALRKRLVTRMRSAAKGGTPAQRARLAEEAKSHLEHFGGGPNAAKARTSSGPAERQAAGGMSTSASPPAAQAGNRTPRKLPPEPKGEVGEAIDIQGSPRIFGGRGPRLQYTVAEERGDQVRLSSRPDGSGGQWMPKASLRHFVDDLHGVVRGPAGGPGPIGAVIDGKATLLGKGNDGLMFKVGRYAVKVSTTVPFQPDNPGHRSPEEAMKHLEQAAKLGEKLRKAGVPGILPSKIVRHGDKAFEVRELLRVPARFTQDQVNQIAAALETMHQKGYSMRDKVQAGVAGDGKAYLFDLGQAAPIREGTAGKHDREDDLSSLRTFAAQHGALHIPQTAESIDDRWTRAIDPKQIKIATFLGAKSQDKMRREIAVARDAKIAGLRARHGPDDPEIEMVQEDAEAALAALSEEKKA